MDKTRVFLTGVGGQGTLTATNLLAEIAADSKMPVTAGEIHGMAQRGGIVHSFVLIGGSKSPKITQGEADVLLGFEPLETMRALEFLHPDGVVVSSLSPVLPLSVCMGRDTYPDIETIREKCRLSAKTAHFVPCGDLARETGVMQTANMVLMGALFASGLLPLGLENLRSGIKKHLKPKIVDVNLQAIELGAQSIS
ncbi:MAG: indolepyruvate oxidoreductase subunit beta [Desulfonatronovibrionaceae bacterium]